MSNHIYSYILLIIYYKLVCGGCLVFYLSAIQIYTIKKQTLHYRPVGRTNPFSLHRQTKLASVVVTKTNSKFRTLEL
jgi:hypothetical protein